MTAAPASPAEAVERLERLADHVAATADDDLACWLVPAIADYLASDGAEDLDHLLGLRPGPGQRGWATARRLAERDVAVLDAVRAFWPEATPHGAAVALHAELLAHERASWRHGDRDAETCPPRLAGTVRACTWRILRATAGEVPSADRLRRVLASWARATTVPAQRP